MPSPTGRILTSPRLGRLVLSLAWPVIVSMALQSLFTIVDLFWVGRLGAGAVAAVSIAVFASWSLMAVGRVVTVGALSLVSRGLGGRRDREAAHTALQAFSWAAALGLLVALAGNLGAGPLFRAVTPDPEVQAMGGRYLRILCTAAPFWYLSMTWEETFRASGDTRTPFLVLAAAVGFNFLLDPLFILGIGPFPRWEVAGAALVSGASHVFAVVCYLGIVRRGAGPVPFRAALPGFRPSVGSFRKLASVGVPMASIGIMYSAVYVILGRITAGHGTAALAALGLGNRIESFSFLTVHALGIATAAVVGQNLGAGHVERAKKLAAAASRQGLAIGLGATVVFLLFPGPLIRIFTDDPSALREGTRFLRILGYCQILQAWELVLEGAFAGAGHTLPSMVISLSLSILRIPSAWFLAGPMGLGTDGIWWTITVTAGLRGVLVRWWWGRETWNRGRFPPDDGMPPGARLDVSPESV